MSVLFRYGYRNYMEKLAAQPDYSPEGNVQQGAGPITKAELIKARADLAQRRRPYNPGGNYESYDNQSIGPNRPSNGPSDGNGGGKGPGRRPAGGNSSQPDYSPEGNIQQMAGAATSGDMARARAERNARLAADAEAEKYNRVARGMQQGYDGGLPLNQPGYAKGTLGPGLRKGGNPVGAVTPTTDTMTEYMGTNNIESPAITKAELIRARVDRANKLRPYDPNGNIQQMSGAATSGDMARARAERDARLAADAAAVKHNRIARGMQQGYDGGLPLNQPGYAEGTLGPGLRRGGNPVGAVAPTTDTLTEYRRGGY